MIHRYIIEATDEVKGFEEAIERLDREWGIEELEPCNDAISRQAVLDLIEHYNSDGLGSVFFGYKQGVKFADTVNKLPSVTPQEPDDPRWD